MFWSTPRVLGDRDRARISCRSQRGRLCREVCIYRKLVVEAEVDVVVFGGAIDRSSGRRG